MSGSGFSFHAMDTRASSLPPSVAGVIKGDSFPTQENLFDDAPDTEVKKIP
jgi:hypothetical protein